MAVDEHRWSARLRIGLAIVAVIAVVFVAVVHFRSAAPTAQERATQTLADAGAPVGAAFATPVSSYHWPSCEQGDCFTLSREFRLQRPLSLAEISTELDAWAADRGLVDASVDACIRTAELSALPAEHGCYRVWREPGHDAELVTVWVHFTSPAVVKVAAGRAGPGAWRAYGSEPVAGLTVEVTDADPLPS